MRIAGVASTGEETLLSAEEEIPHIVLMDIRLHGVLGGVETAAQIRSRFDVTVVCLSGFAEQKLLDREMETESYGRQAKPIEMKERPGKNGALKSKFGDGWSNRGKGSFSGTDEKFLLNREEVELAHGPLGRNMLRKYGEYPLSTGKAGTFEQLSKELEK